MFLTTFWSHARAVQAAAAALGVRAGMPFSDFTLRLDAGDRSETWRPKFTAQSGGRLIYADSYIPGTVGFAGWTPYPLRQWPIALDKSAFKHHAIAAGVATPSACFDPARIDGPFIVKQASSSFGEGIRGPFLSYLEAEPEQRLREGEYYENFLVGLIAKAWYWGAECVAIELVPPSIVTGDGRSTLRELVAARRNARGEDDWPLVERLARYCGIASLEEVLAPGKEVLVEYRYGSRYDTPSRDNTNALQHLHATELGGQFARAGAVFAAAIGLAPEPGASMFTLDAIVDADGQAWFLEMNCNPLVHPDAYAAMLATRFADASACAEALA